MNKYVTNNKKDTWVITMQEQHAVMKSYNQLKSELSPLTKEEDLLKIDKAFSLALNAHAGTHRKSGEPYIMHPLRVASIVAQEIGLGPTSIIAAILHDVVEDTSVSINEIRSIFGSQVWRITRGLTKLKKEFSWDRSMQVENFKKLLLNASEDNRIILIKLADRLDNMRYLDALTRRKQLRIAAETQQIYAPIAHRLGLNQIKSQLEDLYLKYTYPEVYYKIAQNLAATRHERTKNLNAFAKRIKEALTKDKLEFEIQERVKSIYSIWRKIEQKKIPFEEIYDLVALRIILRCPPERDKMLCWQVYGIISNIYPSNTHRLRDLISTPKSNGYKSLHATLMSDAGEWVEIQIRTERMHKIAEKGVAAHWEYKKDIALGEGALLLERWLSEVRQVLEEGASDSINLMEDFKLSLFHDEIFVFTKEGVRIFLPKGATVLDFAVETLDEEGLKCSGAMIHGSFVPVNYVLKHDEQVELMLSEKPLVQSYWGEIAKTAKTRRRLKSFYRKEYLDSLQKGKQLAKNELKKLSLSINKSIEALLRDLFDEKSVEQMYCKLGNKAISTKMLKWAIMILAEIKKRRPEAVKSGMIPPLQQIKKELVVHAKDSADYHLAPCCRPIPDEEIFGVMKADRRVQIHRVDCKNAPRILSTEGAKIVKARWKRGAKEEGSFLIHLVIRAAHRKGMVKDIIKEINTEVEIESLSFLEETNYIKGNLTIQVNDDKRLSDVMQKLRKIPGVVYLERMGKV